MRRGVGGARYEAGTRPEGPSESGSLSLTLNHLSQRGRAQRYAGGKAMRRSSLLIVVLEDPDELILRYGELLLRLGFVVKLHPR